MCHSVLQWVTVCCKCRSVLQCNAVRCSVLLLCRRSVGKIKTKREEPTQQKRRAHTQHTTSHYNATQCTTPQHTATCCNTWQHPATHGNAYVGKHDGSERRHILLYHHLSVPFHNNHLFLILLHLSPLPLPPPVFTLTSSPRPLFSPFAFVLVSCAA